MASRNTLRAWSGSGWPPDDFTIEDNRTDLERHEREHREGVAFTYTVLTPHRSECLGCVYLTPLRWLQDDNPSVETVSPEAAVIGFWVVEALLVDGLEGRLLEELRLWLRQYWSFPAVYFAARAANVRQVALFEQAGLTRVGSVSVSGRVGSFLLFSEPPGGSRPAED